MNHPTTAMGTRPVTYSDEDGAIAASGTGAFAVPVQPQVGLAPTGFDHTIAEMSAADQIALDGYRAAAAFIGADSWDGCSDCMDILKAAKATDILYNPTPDDTATALRNLRSRYWGEHAAHATIAKAEDE